MKNKKCVKKTATANEAPSHALPKTYVIAVKGPALGVAKGLTRFIRKNDSIDLCSPWDNAGVTLALHNALRLSKPEADAYLNALVRKMQGPKDHIADFASNTEVVAFEDAHAIVEKEDEEEVAPEVSPAAASGNIAAPAPVKDYIIKISKAACSWPGVCKRETGYLVSGSTVSDCCASSPWSNVYFSLHLSNATRFRSEEAASSLLLSLTKTINGGATEIADFAKNSSVVLYESEQAANEDEDIGIPVIEGTIRSFADLSVGDILRHKDGRGEAFIVVEVSDHDARVVRQQHICNVNEWFKVV